MAETIVKLDLDFNAQLARRKHPRREFLRKMGLLLAGKHSVADGYEIGEGGAAFDTEIEIPEDSLFVLSFQIPGGSFMVVTAQLRSLVKKEDGQYRAGCHFQNIKFEQRREIRTFVSARI